jgi:hypothetical protein
MQRIAVIINGRVAAIHTNIPPGTILTYDKLADITFRPETKVGEFYPFPVNQEEVSHSDSSVASARNYHCDQ